MRYTEFEKAICRLGKDYRVTQNDDYIYVVYRDNEILEVLTKDEFISSLVSIQDFNECPKKQAVWYLSSRLAATPLDEREEKKYNVIIGIVRDDEFESLVWAKDDMRYLLATTDLNDLREDYVYQFTESEFQDLLKYIKTLPQGDKQVEIAKIGKTLVND